MPDIFLLAGSNFPKGRKKRDAARETIQTCALVQSLLVWVGKHREIAKGCLENIAIVVEGSSCSYENIIGLKVLDSN